MLQDISSISDCATRALAASKEYQREASETLEHGDLRLGTPHLRCPHSSIAQQGADCGFFCRSASPVDRHAAHMRMNDMMEKLSPVDVDDFVTEMELRRSQSPAQMEMRRSQSPAQMEMRRSRSPGGRAHSPAGQWREEGRQAPHRHLDVNIGRTQQLVDAANAAIVDRNEIDVRQISDEMQDNIKAGFVRTQMRGRVSDEMQDSIRSGLHPKARAQSPTHPSLARLNQLGNNPQAQKGSQSQPLSPATWDSFHDHLHHEALVVGREAPAYPGQDSGRVTRFDNSFEQI